MRSCEAAGYNSPPSQERHASPAFPAVRRLTCRSGHSDASTSGSTVARSFSSCDHDGSEGSSSHATTRSRGLTTPKYSVLGTLCLSHQQLLIWLLSGRLLRVIATSTFIVQVATLLRCDHHGPQGVRALVYYKRWCV